MVNNKNSIHLDQVDLNLILVALANQSRQYTAAGGDYFNSRAALVDDLLSRLEDRPAGLDYELCPHEVTQ